LHLINLLKTKIMRHKIIFPILAVCICSFNMVKGQCDPKLLETFQKETVNENSLFYLKNFPVLISENEQESKYSFVLAARTWYRFYYFESDLFDGEGHMELHSENGIISSNINIHTNKKDKYFDIKCNKTQVYYLRIEKDKGKEFCAEVILTQKGNSKSNKNLDILSDEEVFFVVDEMPLFKSGEKSLESFKEWVRQNLVYPEEAKRKKVEGRVYIQFVVSSSGKVEDVSVAKGLHESVDSYVVELVSGCPVWAKPGRQDGKPVKVGFTIPIEFKL
jgi:TonB family protein